MGVRNPLPTVIKKTRKTIVVPKERILSQFMGVKCKDMHRKINVFVQLKHVKTFILKVGTSCNER